MLKSEVHVFNPDFYISHFTHFQNLLLFDVFHLLYKVYHINFLNIVNIDCSAASNLPSAKNTFFILSNKF